jgi:hypothetical protein
MIRRFTAWTRPGGRVFVCVDSLIAVVLELTALRRNDEALRILEFRKDFLNWMAELSTFTCSIGRPWSPILPPPAWSTSTAEACWSR